MAWGRRMLDNVGDIAAFYDSEPQREDDRLLEHQLEYELTWRYLDQHLPGEGSVLDLGAATGRYSIPLAKRGYAVTAVDLSSELIEHARLRVAEEGVADRVHLAVADVRDLSAITRSDFDAVLMMGPLYHLIEDRDRRLALRHQVTEYTEATQEGRSGVPPTVCLSARSAPRDRVAAVSVRSEFVWEKVEQGTRVTIYIDGKGRGVLKLIPQKVVEAAFSEELRNTLDRLRKQMESGKA